MEAAAEAADAERAFAELELNNACAERDSALERVARLEADAAVAAADSGESQDDATQLAAAQDEVCSAYDVTERVCEGASDVSVPRTACLR